MMSMQRSRITDNWSMIFAALIATCFSAALLTGCSGSNVEAAPPKPRAAPASFKIDIAPIMRGTIASESIMLGYQPVVVRGYGMMVNLKGTGSRDYPPPLRAHMLAEMARNGVGKQSTGWGDLKPEALLDSMDTAVVIVEAVIPPASVGPIYSPGGDILDSGTRFDVRVYADPRSGTTSLEGGMLWTTELRPGPLSTGREQANTLALARGPIFVNPFAEPGAVGRDTISRRSGRILNGGMALKDLPLKLRLATPSHARAEILQQSINARFAQEPGQRSMTAEGQSDTTVRINVPPSWRADPGGFIRLLRHTTIRLSGAQQYAANVKRALLADPSVAKAATARWEAMGPLVLPVIRELYTHPEESPRLAALQAGARLDDALAIPHLIDMAMTSSTSFQVDAIKLLKDMRNSARIGLAFGELINDDDVSVRLAAYEGMVARNDNSVRRYRIGEEFYVDVVESDYPMIFVTQFGAPRIVIFDEDLSFDESMLFQTWSNRLMVKRDKGWSDIEVYYRDVQSRHGATFDVPPSMEAFTVFLGHKTSVEQPAPGLGLGYSEVVSAIHSLWRKGFINADFKADQDRILAAIIEQQEVSEVEVRPESDDPDFDFMNPSVPGPADDDTPIDLRPIGDLGSAAAPIPSSTESRPE